MKPSNVSYSLCEAASHSKVSTDMTVITAYETSS